MGDIYWGLHIPIASQIIRHFKIKIAIETGSYFGNGAIELSSLCEEVISIDHDPALFKFVNAYYGNLSKIKFLNGHSPDILKQLLPTINSPILFVLDAHWFGCSPRKEFAHGSQCPVLEELQAIKTHCKIKEGSAIIIDDADMFCGALEPPFRSAEFPSIIQVVNLISSIFKDNVVDVIDDIIISGPQGTEKILAEYRQWKKEVGTPKG